VVAAGDSQQLALAMEELANSGELRSQMGQRGHARILEYSPEACAAGIANAVFAAESTLHE
jgi:glycosyltransferase involved in cell wall biosynthesis